jgi:hypothetical protein
MTRMGWWGCLVCGLVFMTGACTKEDAAPKKEAVTPKVVEATPPPAPKFEGEAVAKRFAELGAAMMARDTAKLLTF